MLNFPKLDEVTECSVLSIISVEREIWDTCRVEIGLSQPFRYGCGVDCGIGLGDSECIG